MKKLLAAVLFVILACSAFSFSLDGSLLPGIGITQELPADTYVSGSLNVTGFPFFGFFFFTELHSFDFGISKNTPDRNSICYLNGKAGFSYIYIKNTIIDGYSSRTTYSYSHSLGLTLKSSINFNIIGNFGIGAFCNFYFPIFMMHQNNNTFTNEFKLGFLPSLGLSINLF